LVIRQIVTGQHQPDELITCKNCSYGYSLEAVVVEKLNVSIRPNDRLVVIGRSGSGKSTVLKLFGGLLKPNSGEIIRKSNKAAFVFQERGLLPWLTVMQNVEMPLRLNGLSQFESKNRAERAMSLAKISEASSKYSHQLSTGMSKRAELARILASADFIRLWLMDEPFESLDIENRTILQEILLSESKRTKSGVVIVTHSVTEALKLGTRFAILQPSENGLAHQLVEISCSNNTPLSESDLLKALMAQQDDNLQRI
jgi:ABC-type nitrate/sulfonate/bicarbonate transport system ATPase subunit